jgi:predicted TIM-barrel fold metal-dependent hydrolase
VGQLHRRTFLGIAAAGAVTGASNPAAVPSTTVPIVDCHIHLFDQTRPQGVPYSGGGSNNQPALPPRYRKLAAPLGIVAAIEIEASPWVEDNLWVLEVERADSMMVGSIGNLQPEKPEFREYLDRYHKNPLFLGIRYGNLWDYNLVEQLANPVFVEGLKLLREAGMALDTANPQPDLMQALLRLNDKVPGLRVIADHLPALMWQLNAATRPAVEATLREMAQRPTIYIKVSDVMRIIDGKVSTDQALYQPLLDHLFETFGEDKLIFGSNWPHGPAVDHLPAIVKIVRQYFFAKSRAAAEKYFWKNSLAAYRWSKRNPTQPALNGRI